MKKIMNDVAVQTICYVVNGLQKIRIVDYENTYNCTFDRNGVVVCEGLLKDFLDYKYCKYFEAKCYGLGLDGDTMVFSIITKFEDYK